MRRVDVGRYLKSLESRAVLEVEGKRTGAVWVDCRAHESRGRSWDQAEPEGNGTERPVGRCEVERDAGEY